MEDRRTDQFLDEARVTDARLFLDEAARAYVVAKRDYNEFKIHLSVVESNLDLQRRHLCDLFHEFTEATTHEVREQLQESIQHAKFVLSHLITYRERLRDEVREARDKVLEAWAFKEVHAPILALYM